MSSLSGSEAATQLVQNEVLTLIVSGGSSGCCVAEGVGTSSTFPPDRVQRR